LVASRRRKAAGQFQLRVIVDETIHLYPLPKKGQISIGRAEGCDVRIEDPTVSRHHARIEIEGPTLRVCDDGSSYGLRVRHERVEPGAKIVLEVGDAIEAGVAVLVVEAAPPPSARTSRAKPRRRSPRRRRGS
jgi:two-component system, NtrC family, response regulator AtoC